MTLQAVVAALDGTPFGERAVPAAASLAGATDAPLVLLHVAEPGAAERPFRHEQAATAYLQGVAATVTGPDVTTRVVTDPDPAGALEAELASRPGSVGALSTHGRSGLGAAAFASMAGSVATAPVRPYLLVGPQADEAGFEHRSGPVVACFDDSDSSASLLVLLTEMVPLLDRPVELVTVLHRDGEFLGGHSADRVRALAPAAADRLRAQGLEVAVTLLESLTPAKAVAAYAAEVGATLVAAAPHRKATAAHTVFGSTAMRVVRHAPVPVILGHADGAGAAATDGTSGA